MSIIKKYPGGLVGWSDFFNTDWPEFETVAKWAPAVNVIDNELNYEIEVAAPGIRKEDFNVSVDRGILIIVGKTDNESKEDKKNYTRREFSSRSFEKRFPIPENVDAGMVEASHEDGVLRITLHKKNPGTAEKKSIEVK